MALVPPGIAIPATPPAAFSVFWQASASFWIGENWHGTTSLGRLPNGRSYLRTVIDPVADEVHFASWSIDWGRPCRTGAARCVPHSVGFQVRAADGRLWDRYRAVAETIPTTVEQLRPTAPTVGDRRLPVCRPGQWRLIWVEEYGVITVPGMDPAPRALRVRSPARTGAGPPWSPAGRRDPRAYGTSVVASGSRS